MALNKKEDRAKALELGCEVLPGDAWLEQPVEIPVRRDDLVEAALSSQIQEGGLALHARAQQQELRDAGKEKGDAHHADDQVAEQVDVVVAVHPLQHRRQPAAALAVTLQEVIGHALRGFRADSGQRAQGLDQLSDQARAAHAIQNGSFMPAGRLRPPVRFELIEILLSRPVLSPVRISR